MKDIRGTSMIVVQFKHIWGIPHTKLKDVRKLEGKIWTSMAVEGEPKQILYFTDIDNDSHKLTFKEESIIYIRESTIVFDGDKIYLENIKTP